MLGSLVSLIMYGWIPVTVYLFMRFPPQRALVVSFITATLFLPQAALTLPSNILLDKITAPCFGVLLAILIYDPARFSSFKPGWLDLPMLIWCLCMIPSQITNGLSPISPTLRQVLTWGVPYFLGRIYLNDLAGLRQLAMGIFIGGLAYVPFCLYEGRMSPNLHLMIYGFAARLDFSQAVRLGGYRPTVFMEHGLAVGMWMMAATLAGIWLWQTKVIKKLWNLPVSWLVAVLLITFILCRSTGAYLYLVFGLVILFIGKWFRTAVPLLLLIVGLSSYLYMAATGTLYTTDAVVSFVANANDDRSGSLAFRLKNEEVLSERARQRMIFGWGASGGNQIIDEWGKQSSVTDSLWIIAYGVNGIVGLISFTAVFLLPAWSFFWLRYPARSWSNPKVAPAAALPVVITLYMLDSSLNAFPNAVFVLASGGISGLLLKEPETIKATGARSSVNRRSVAQQRQTQRN